jgi:hypothetical protein
VKNNIKKIIKNLLNEQLGKKPIKEFINDLVTLQDKKELYKFVVKRDVEKIKEKMSEISNRLQNDIGHEYKFHVENFLKQMVYKMYLTKK